MSQYLRGRGLPILAACAVGGGWYWNGRRTEGHNRDPLMMKGQASETLQSFGRQGGLPGKVNLEERDRGRSDLDPRNTRMFSNSPDADSKRSPTKTRDV